MSLSPVPAQGARAAQAANAYANVDRGTMGTTGTGGASAGAFTDALQQALGGVVQSGQEADRQAAQALSGDGNITEVVTALATAELALQTTMAVRDRVVQAYQDIMRMPI